ncbi:hypothetical protein ROZALSC1DRAFT_22633 [Rozella allomycis CSF55]|uniref:RING-type E3 ubiquitin transferase n=1 Tax=Rozella allomycis (strain CSF55) TaxID=988480 RepID=A0A4P9YHK5_ROZAC|nr:hypothetical protein ROZALSC1DRAFT_22633 [Rozella allomycis CSF55]
MTDIGFVKLKLKWFHFIAKIVATKLVPLNVAIFFINGNYPSITRRLLNITYNADFNTRHHSYAILGYILLAKVMLQSILDASRYFKNKQNGQPTMLSERAYHGITKLKCPLCLNTLVHPTVSDCGHLFCWHCINSWALTKLDQTNSFIFREVL